MIEIELPDGTIAEFPEGTPEAEIKRVLRQQVGGPVSGPDRNPDGTYGKPPEGMVANPYTGQMTERGLMAGNEQRQGVSQGESALLGFGEGTTFGASDEMMGGLRAVMPGPGTASERYAFGREKARALSDASRSENPYTHGGAEIAGGATTALTYGVPAMAGRGLGGAMATGAGMGALEGAGYGFLSGEGGAGQRAENALKMGTVGAAIGGAVPGATELVGKGLRFGADMVGGGIDAATGRASQSRANRALARTLAKSGRSPDEIDAILQRAAREGQPEYRAMDALGVPGQRRASAVTRSGGEGSDDIRRFLDQRQVDQPERVSGFVEDAFDGGTATARATRDTLRQGRNQAADIDFGSIRAAGEPVDIRGVVQALDEKIQPFESANISSPTKSILKRLKRQLVGQSDNASYELSDFDKVFQIRKDLRDTIDGLFRQGKNGVAGDLMDIRRSFDNALEASSPQYRKAMDDFRQSSRVIDAVESGQTMARPGERAADSVAAFQRMNPSEQAAARVGYGDKALAKVESSAGGANRARPFTSSKARQEADVIASDPNRFRRQVDREMDMFETRNIVSGGSRTADNLADMQELAGSDMGFLANLLSGRWGEAAMQTGQRGLNAATGMNESTRQRIAQALLSRDAGAFRAALKQVDNASVRKSILDTVVRLGGLQNIDLEALGQ